MKRNTSNNQQRGVPTLVKISKKTMYAILITSIISMVVSIITLIMVMFIPISSNSQLKQISKKIDNLEMLWKLGGGNHNTGTQEETSDDQTVVDQTPDITKPHIEAEFKSIEKTMTEIVKDPTFIKAALELDSSALSIKGSIANVNLKEVVKSDTLLKNLRTSNMYISKAFYATAGENFVANPETSVSKNYQPTNEDWYKYAVAQSGVTDLETKQPVISWSPLQKDGLTNEYIRVGSICIKDKDRIVGVLGVQVSLSKMN